MNCLALYNKLEGLLRKLPGSLHQPILRELEPLKTLFLEQRPPRLVILGDRTVSLAEVVNGLFRRAAIEVLEAKMPNARQSGVWETIAIGGQGSLRVLDARRPLSITSLTRALAAAGPDVFVFVLGKEGLGESTAADLEHAAAVVACADSHHETRARVLGFQCDDGAAEDERMELHGALLTQPALADRTAGVLLISERERVVEQVAGELPAEAQLEMARLSRSGPLQHQIGDVLVRSMTAICGAIGAQPIPLADFPILTSLQAAMVASLAHISGREFSTKAAGEFVGALGANIGAGLLLREGARAAVKFVPGWGQAISGGIAAAGTYAIGRAAAAYFIDGIPLKAAKEIFRRKQRPAALQKEIT